MAPTMQPTRVRWLPVARQAAARAAVSSISSLVKTGREAPAQTREVVERLIEVASQERREGFARDLEGAFGYLGQRPDVDRDQIGLVRDDLYHKVRRACMVGHSSDTGRDWGERAQCDAGP